MARTLGLGQYSFRAYAGKGFQAKGGKGFGYGSQRGKGTWPPPRRFGFGKDKCAINAKREQRQFTLFPQGEKMSTVLGAAEGPKRSLESDKEWCRPRLARSNLALPVTEATAQVEGRGNGSPPCDEGVPRSVGSPEDLPQQAHPEQAPGTLVCFNQNRAIREDQNQVNSRLSRNKPTFGNKEFQTRSLAKYFSFVKERNVWHQSRLEKCILSFRTKPKGAMFF